MKVEDQPQSSSKSHLPIYIIPRTPPASPHSLSPTIHRLRSMLLSHPLELHTQHSAPISSDSLTGRLWLREPSTSTFPLPKSKPCTRFPSLNRVTSIQHLNNPKPQSNYIVNNTEAIRQLLLYNFKGLRFQPFDPQMSKWCCAVKIGRAAKSSPSL